MPEHDTHCPVCEKGYDLYFDGPCRELGGYVHAVRWDASWYMSADGLRPATDAEKMRQALEAVAKGWTMGQPSSMNLVIAEVDEILESPEWWRNACNPKDQKP